MPFNLKPKKFASVSSFMTCSRFVLNVCFVIGNLSRWFVMTCWSAASLHLHLLNVSNWVYNLIQTHTIPYPFVGFYMHFKIKRTWLYQLCSLGEKIKLRVPIVQNRNIFIYLRLYERVVVRAATSFLFRNCLMLFS